MNQNLRARLALLLDGLRQGRETSLEALPKLDRHLPDARDRALARAMLYACLRGIERYERWLHDLLERPLPNAAAPVESVLLLALASLDQGIDGAHAVVSASVDAIRGLEQPGLAGLGNAVLRRAQRELAQLRALPPRTDAERYNHPTWLIERLRRDWGADQAAAILQANNEPAPLWLRVNRQRANVSDYRAKLAEQGLDAALAPGLPDALCLADSLDVLQLPGFPDGLVSVQDGAAQLAVVLLDLQPGQRVLDACAAPGGKLSHILEQGIPLAQVQACDVSAARLSRMQENLQRMQFTATIDWLQADAGSAKAFAPGTQFERILLDAPCTGTGVIRRHPDIRLLRKPGQVQALKQTQARLLDRLFALLAPGGRLVYATCSVLQEENAGQVAAFLERQADAWLRPVDADWFGRDTGFGRQNLPGEQGLDGFFYAVLKRRAS
ncbi:16S rRNA (cytosine(967)-C(5))-methyltransferase RsmB [Ahniella affigens]|uniref:16S rRNA (cytosine(967)-C(5))-methyltransferase RsmB n=1 Tax=Ahniella affigens TaxID=2021234 RepID=UPI001475417D|nr:16S rRNA (cytosine(967)-C(5))-methyltransferase RsmB [Ahniella affigens]